GEARRYVANDFLNLIALLDGMSFAFYERGARGDVPAGRKMIIMRRKVLLWGNTETLKGGKPVDLSFLRSLLHLCGCIR
uniref:hypothetical protein n=1 Tax=Dialister sp. TaxID=1955814 RepID=UPI0040297F42